MARYGKQHKEATRQRIIETAGARLKQDGIDGAGVAILMKDAGLTNGAFYAHFDSKEHLVAEVVASELASQRTQIALLDDGAAGVEQLVRGYLTTTHRDDPGRGCPSAALLDEIARGGDVVRRAYTFGVMAIVDDVAGRLAGMDAPDGSTGEPEGESIGESFRTQALSAYALMIGTIQLARALTDDARSEHLVEQGLANALELLGLKAG